jgi:predicted nucleic acid-binding protein
LGAQGEKVARVKTAVDTNILVRLLTHDDPEQHESVVAFLASTDCVVQSSVILETEWVLRSVYRYGGTEIGKAFDILLQTEGIEVENAPRLRMALQGLNAGIEFADAFHLAGAQHAGAFATFDAELRRRARKSFTKPAVVKPPSKRSQRTP